MSTDRQLPDSSAETDRVARVIEAAGSRDDHAAAIDSLRPAVHASWRAAVERRRHERATQMRRTLALAAGLLLLVAAGWVAIRLSGRGDEAVPPTVLATALRVVGEARLIEPDGESRALTVGATLHAGDRLETTTGARAALQLGTGRSLRLDHDTTATLATGERVELARGGVYVSSEPKAPGALAVATALGLAREVGTRFAVELDGEQLAVRVRDGSVVLERDGERLAVPAGEELIRSASGEIARRPLPASDPSWEWVVATAPPFELEGATAAEYLAWIARETGWRVVYDSSEAARSASAAELHGSIAGDDPRDTLETVLPTADLAYRLEGDVLHVLPALGEPESR